VTRPDALRLSGRVLFLTRDAAVLRRQLEGEDLAPPELDALLDQISTDEMAPAWASYHYDERLGEYCLTGLRGGVIREGEVRRGGFEVLVGGESFGCGSSRETAPYAQRVSGVRLIFARSFEKIFRQNAQNLGILTSTDFALLERLLAGDAVELDEVCRSLDPLSAAIARSGGLFGYHRDRVAGKVPGQRRASHPRPMTLAEKIIARHAVSSSAEEPGVASVAPGEALFVRTDVRFSHDYVTAMLDSLFRSGFGEDAKVADPGSVFLFRDHLTFAERVLGEGERRLGLVDRVRELASKQEAFARRHGIELFGEVTRAGSPGGSEAICHNKVIESLAWPSQIVIGTDSHTVMAGALGCLAFGVGSTDMASAFYTRDVRLTVPETVRVELRGEPSPEVAAKDVMLWILSQELVAKGGVTGKVLEFVGDGLEAFGLDERATLTNMAVEASGFSGIVAPDARVLDELAALRGLSQEERAGLEARVTKGDPEARVAAEIVVDLSKLEPMVALPSDPRNGIPLRDLAARGERVRIDIAYAGSCTGAKRRDMDMYAAVLGAALARGEMVAPHVELYIQFGSQLIRRYAEARGYLDIFERAGAKILDPACGACIRAGPGVSSRPDQVTVSAINRNFPGRSGPGKVYLASPYTVAASAVAGYITASEVH
jgi:3-isopropylmalate/(R)-2-methylmalate dehydratase large subunit